MRDLEPFEPPFWVNPHAKELDHLLKSEARGARAEMASHEAILAGGKAVESGDRRDHDDAKQLHLLAAEEHRSFCRNFNPAVTDHSLRVAGLHDEAAKWHEERGTVWAKPEDFRTPESTDAFYVRKYGTSHPPERGEVERQISGRGEENP